jgi:homocitrate synthase NifV
MRPRRYLVDSTLRDGEQAPGLSFTREQKLGIAAALDAAGVYQIEAGAPAVSDFEKETIVQIIANRRQARVSVWVRLMPADIRQAIDCQPDLIHISIPVSRLHIYGKLRKDEAWVMGQLRSCLALIKKSGIPASAGLEDTFRAEPSFLLRVVKVLADGGVRRIRLSDTVGIATPSQCRETVQMILGALHGQSELGFHAHNDLGMAVANTLEAMKAGCLYADTTLSGIGERAGNCDFAQLIGASSSLYDWGVSAATAQRVQDKMGTALFCLGLGEMTGKKEQGKKVPSPFCPPDTARHARRPTREMRHQYGELPRTREQAAATSQWGVRGC